MMDLPPTYVQAVVLRQDAKACVVSDYTAWCSGSGANPFPLTVADIKSDQRAAFAKFTPDVSADPMRWTSHWSDVQSAKPWSGQCNDMTITVLDILGRRGLAAADIYRAVVISGTGMRADHMIGIVRIDGRFWVVGDTAAPTHDPYPLEEMRYTIMMINHASDGAVWHRVKR